ncbi:MAG: hypothetical protein LKJ47_04960 [Bifidobacteriaceae bacterium]|jgi:hypothetical protein|nr:hypothetical protein [Bifidobacteriaceae bacterium]
MSSVEKLLPKGQTRFTSKQLAEAFGQSAGFFDNQRFMDKGPSYLKFGDEGSKANVLYLRDDVIAWAKDHFHMTSESQ